MSRAGTQPQRPWLPAPAEGWSTVILTVVMVQIIVGCIQTLKWTPNTAILTWTAWAGMVLGFILAKQQRFPQWLVDIPSLLLGIGAALLLTAQASTGGNVGAMVGNIANWVQTASAGNSSNDESIFLLFLAVLTMLLGYLTMWLIFRARNPWLAVLMNCIILLINLNYATEDRIFFAIIFLLTALLLLVRFNLAERMRIWKLRGLRFSPVLTWDFMQTGILFVFVVILVSSLIPNGASNQSLMSLWNGDGSPWQRVQSSFERVFSINVNNQNARVGFGSTATIRGSVVLPTTTVLTYTTDDTSGAFLAALTLDRFDGHTWTINEDPTITVSPNEELSPESGAVTKVTSSVRIVNPPIGPYLYGIGEIISSTIPMMVRIDKIGLSATDTIGSFTSWTAKNAVQANDAYTVVSTVSAATDAQLAAVPSPLLAPSQYPRALLDRYTQLPNDLKGQNLLRTTARQWTAQATTMYDKLEAIVKQFHDPNVFRYSATNPEPPATTDAAEFLLTTKAGYCTWYATTMAMMARTLGYPARVVEGFSTGVYNLKANAYIVAGTNSHMWTQVYFADYGWINFEPSASFDPFRRAVAPVNSTGPVPTPPPVARQKPTKPIENVPTNEKPVVPVPAAVQSPINSTGGKILLSLSTLIAILILGALGIVAWWRSLFRRLSPNSQMFARMSLLGRFAGVPVQQSQTASEYGELLGRQLPAEKETIDEITTRYVYERWSPTTTEPNLSLGEQWQRLQATLLRTIARRHDWRKRVVGWLQRRR